MKHIISVTRRASASVLRGSGAGHPRQIPAQPAAGGPVAALSARPVIFARESTPIHTCTANTHRCRWFGSTPVRFADSNAINPTAWPGSDHQPTVTFQVKEHERTGAQQDDDWFQAKREGPEGARREGRGEWQRPNHNRDRQRRNERLYGKHHHTGRGGRHHAGRGGRYHAGRGGRHHAGHGGRHHAGRGGRHPSPRPRDTPRKQREEPRQPRPIATTPWICLQNIPPSSLLEDVVDCIAQVMQREIDSGIIDLDKAEQFVEGQEEVKDEKEKVGEEKETSATTSMEDLPFWDPSEHDASLNGSYIQEARLLLSVLGRPCGWYLRMPDRSCVQAILSHADEDANRGPGRRLAVSIGGRTLTVGEFDPSKREVLSGAFGSDVPLVERSFDRAVKLRLDDSVIRVENCPVQSRAADLRYLFRRYDIIDTRRLQDDVASDAVQLLVQGNYGRRKGGEKFYPNRKYHGNDSEEIQPLRTTTPVATNTFIIRFETAADARAAIRDMQVVDFEGRQLRLAQYPKQMLH